MKYKYHLLKYQGKKTRLTCPQCGRPHCFAPYVDDKENIVGPEYGRCNHEVSCGYVMYPPSEPKWNEHYPKYNTSYNRPKTSTITRFPAKAPLTQSICTIPTEIVQKSVRTKPLSDLLHFLLTLFDFDTINRLVDEYKIGVTKGGDTVFYQIDQEGKCRTGKVMKYDRETGRRIKDTSTVTPITWVHSLLKRQGVLPKEWEISQCLFGEHLLKLYPDRIVCLVESEKTAIICSALIPDCIWLATGGKGQLNDRVEILHGRRVIAFPDVDGYETWCQKAKERPHLNIIISDLLERIASDDDREKQIDIADLLIRWKQGFDTIPSPLPQPPPSPQNPVFLEIQKHFSPEYHKSIFKLIEELDLELVRVN